jgi:hypothetical protein
MALDTDSGRRTGLEYTVDGLLDDLMRRLLAIIVSCAFGLASVQAPFLHTHEHSDPQGHGGPLHSHLKLAHSHDHEDEHADKTSIHEVDPDDDAQMLDSFTFVKTSKAKPFLALVLATVPFGVPVETEFVHSVTPRGHDPPDIVSAPARAPPA